MLKRERLKHAMEVVIPGANVSVQNKSAQVYVIVKVVIIPMA